MRSKVLFLSVALWCFAIAVAFAGPLPSDQVMAAAEGKAQLEQKAIFLRFGASWSGWCKRLDAYLDRSDVKPVFEKYFVPVKLVIQEDTKNKALENPGAGVWMSKIGGPEGLPFYAFLDARGALIVNSKLAPPGGGPGQNISYPSGQPEVAWFVQMVKKAAPKISAADLKVIEAGLRK